MIMYLSKSSIEEIDKDKESVLDLKKKTLQFFRYGISNLLVRSCIKKV